jgi:VWFA-related protein
LRRAQVVLFCLGLVLASSVGRRAVATTQQQSESAPAKNAAQEPAGEMATHDEPTTFKVNVRLVLVRVVVRDSHGHAIGNLHKEDFELLDSGKLQVISHFSVEQPATQVPVKPSEPSPAESTPAESTAGTGPQAAAAQPSIAGRFIAYVFDDVHIKFGDLTHVRAAFDRRLAGLQPTERIAIFSTSGQSNLDFTDDRAKLHDTLAHLQPRPVAGSGVTQCPDISYYMADLIQNKHDPEAMQVAIADALNCAYDGDRQFLQAAQSLVQSETMNRLASGDTESRLALGVLKDAVRRISAMPGQRNLIVVSPGFLTSQLEPEYTDVVDRALRGQIIISSLDARGLYTVLPGGDLSKVTRPDPTTQTLETQFALRSAVDEGDVLAVLADGTGGTFFHNSNDMDEGLRRVADTPEYYYMLGFTPQNLKMNGSFHNLNVNLKVRERYVVQARRGYYAPSHSEDAAEEASREVEDEVFSVEELHDLPVDLHTQFFKASDDAARLTVLAHLDVKHFRYRKVQGRSRNDLTIVAALFDHNGNFVQGNQKTLQMRWLDQTLENRLSSGITLRASFDVKPGNYLVRLVVRDAEGQQMAAENGAVDIP